MQHEFIAHIVPSASIRMVYRNKANEISERIVDVNEVNDARRYFVAFCHNREEWRTFSFDGVLFTAKTVTPANHHHKTLMRSELVDANRALCYVGLNARLDREETSSLIRAVENVNAALSLLG
jgi:hypothetical protein